MKLNLNGWKKVSSHKDHSVLKNKDGHELKVVHRALSKDAKGQLDKLGFADGGHVEDKGPKIDPKKAKEMQDGATQSGWQPKQWLDNAKEGLGIAKSEGGKVMMAYGETVPDDDQVDDSEDTETADATETPEGVPLPEGGMSPEEVTADNAATVSPEATVGFNPNSPSGKEMAAMQAQPAATAPPAGVQPMDPNSPAGPQAPSPLEQYKSSLDKEGQLRQEAGDRQAKLANDHVRAIDKIHADSQSVLKPMQEEILSIAHDKSQDKIDENAYWKDHSRVLSAIGLALSAAGGTGEAAMNFLSKAIDRNIDAQKAVIKNKNDKTQTLLGALQKQYGDGLIAENMAKASEAASYVAKAQAIAAKSNSPIQQEAVKRMYMEFAQKYQAGVQQAAIVHSADKAIHSGDNAGINAGLQVLDKVDPKRAASIRERYVPGYGIAERPVSRFALQAINDKTNLIDNVKQIREFIGKHPLGSLKPDEVKYITGLSLESQGLYRKALGASTSENEAHTISKIIPDNPASIYYQFGRGASLRALDDSISKQRDTLLQQHGLKVPEREAQAETKEAGGFTWQKVGNNWHKIK